jgi:2-oxoglutarate/2-oxoacid ferredoxin oxidoreductase subunit beta
VGTLLNPDRPPVYCPGCSHETSLHALDRAFAAIGLKAHELVIVSDIGCSGLFDTFFTTHAFHGLHGRALTYAAGIKLARPDLKVVVTMGDGGLGIGGAHLLAACRRNLDLTLLILNNFNFGMTGGQFSCTTPPQAEAASGFLNALEKPLDVCSVAAAAGAPFVARTSVYGKGLFRLLEEAIRFQGFSLVDLWGLCTGRYLKRNKLTPGGIEKGIAALPPFSGPVEANLRREYGSHYREKSLGSGVSGLGWQEMEALFPAPVTERREVVLLGSAGDRIVSAGLLLAHAAMLGGMQATQKNDHNITVMRGPSVSELIVSPQPIVYTGVEQPDVLVALSREGILRRRELFARTAPEARVIREKGLEIPPTAARIQEVDFKERGIKKAERALTALALLAATNDPITAAMLAAALRRELKGDTLAAALDLVKNIDAETPG